jgi:uncharacterized protein (DUF488 family)
MIFTIGYERATPSRLVQALEKAGVKTLIDVRELPASRRPGFSKRKLAEELAKAGIKYEHLRGLGTPKEGRIANRARDFETFWRIVDEKMATDEAHADLDRAETLAREGTVALLCLEHEHATCHRSRVAADLQKRTGQEVEHLHLELPFEPPRTA